jgi:hypothetical protein
MRKSISREALLRAAEVAVLGSGASANVEQGTCIVFREERAYTFNGEMGVSVPAPDLGFVGAVPCAELLAMCQKFNDPILTVDSSNPGQAVFYGAGKKRCGLTLESEIRLPVGLIEVPETWKALSPAFADAISVTEKCASNDTNTFVITCLHITPTGIEACDNYQAIRYGFDTGVDKNVLCRREHLRCVVGLGMTEFSESTNWFHFRNADGCVLSLRRFSDAYPDIEFIFKTDGCTPATLPAGLAEVAEKCSIFGSDKNDTVMVEVKTNAMRITRKTERGFYDEIKDVQYAGPPLMFMINPKLLTEIGGRSVDCLLSAGKICVTTAKFQYVACLGVAS